MRVLVVEDEEIIGNYILDLLKKYPANLTVLGRSKNLQEARVMIENSSPDLVFLDINLPDGNIFTLLRELETIPFKIIFITAYDEYAINAIKVGALDYLLKPFDKEELYAAIKKVQLKESSKEQVALASQAIDKEHVDRIAIKQQNVIAIIVLDELQYCKSDGPYTEFYLDHEETIVASSTLKEFESVLPEKFIRTHKSYIVNSDKIKHLDKVNDYLLLENGEKIPVSSRRKSQIIKYLVR